jgi:hypothetical protein
MENDFQCLCIFARTDDGRLVGGLKGKTCWQYLEGVSVLFRKSGHASRFLAGAESGACPRGCKHAMFDTFSFQAPEFYEKLACRESGRLSGFCGK